MSRPSNLSDASQAARHAVVTRLQILTLTAELLALELRDGHKMVDEVQVRGRTLDEALERVKHAARSFPVRHSAVTGGDGGTLANTASLREIQVYVGFIARYASEPDIERDVLAEYVDALHDHTMALIQSIDGSSDQ